MIHFECTSKGLQINGKEYSFPLKKETLIELFGPPVVFPNEYNEVYIWHDLGLRGFSKDSIGIDTLEVTYQVEEYMSAVRSSFSGVFMMNGEVDPRVYYDTHKKERVKLWDGDSSGAFVFQDVSVWYSIRDTILHSLSLSAYEEPLVESVETLPLEKDFAYLHVVWQDWKTAIEQVIDSDNCYYNLTHGLTQEQLTQVEAEFDEIKLPLHLINFYKAGNVKWDAVTSAFSIHVNGWDYDLLPFDRIPHEWEMIQELFDEEEEIDEETKDQFDTKLKCNSYANKGWIPFAEGRNGDYLLFDTDPSKTGVYGQIIELQNEAWTRIVVAQSLEELIYRAISSIQHEQAEKYKFILENGAF